MIVKHIACTAAQGSNFARLAAYITHGQGKSERVEKVWASNCWSDEPSEAATDIIITQRRNTRSKADKTYHLVVSFPHGERPGESVLRDIEKEVCEGLGFGEHQRITAFHTDTDHAHLHIAINKIHPVKLTIHDPFYPYLKLGKISAGLEIKHGLQIVNHETTKSIEQGRAGDMEAFSGRESLLGWINRNCVDELLGADSWRALHTALAQSGLEIRVRGRGFVVADGHGTFVKASTIDRSLSKGKLEAKFGVFEKSQATIAQVERIRTYAKQPLSLDGKVPGLYEQYLEERYAGNDAWREMMERVGQEYMKDIEGTRSDFDSGIKILQGVKGPRLGKMIIASYLFDSMMREQAAAREGREGAVGRTGNEARGAGWLDWLKGRAEAGSSEAIRTLKQRSRLNPGSFNLISGQGSTTAGYPCALDGITKNGVSVLCGENANVRDTDQGVVVSNGATDAVILESVRAAAGRYGCKITVDGEEGFGERVVMVVVEQDLDVMFSDMHLEQHREILKRTQEEAKQRQEELKQRADAERQAEAFVARRNIKRRTDESIKEHAPYIDEEGQFELAVEKILGGRKLYLLEGKDNKVLVMSEFHKNALEVKWAVWRGEEISIKDGQIETLSRGRGLSL